MVLLVKGHVNNFRKCGLQKAVYVYWNLLKTLNFQQNQFHISDLNSKISHTVINVIFSLLFIFSFTDIDYEIKIQVTNVANWYALGTAPQGIASTVIGKIQIKKLNLDQSNQIPVNIRCFLQIRFSEILVDKRLGRAFVLKHASELFE